MKGQGPIKITLYSIPIKFASYIFLFSDEEDENYSVPHNARQHLLPPPPGKGRIVIGPNVTEPSRRKLPPQPQRASAQQSQRPHLTTQRALPATAHIYGNIGGPGLSYISADRGSPASAMLTNLANKRIMSNVKR